MQPMLLLLCSWRSFKLLPVLILSLTCLCATAHARAQNDHPVTLSGNGITLRTVFKAIKRQTGFAVMYSTQATALNQDEKVNVNFKNTPLDDVLAYVLRGKELEWKYNDDVLIIHKKAPAPAEKKIEVDSTVTPAMITGKVTDAAGAALPGATVQVKGASQGTTTDEYGNFSLPKVANGETLLVSMVGYETQAIPVKGRRILAQMNVAVSKLDETVVIAYGTTTQRLSTGNVATIKAKDIEKQPVNNPLLALQGRVPGLFITQNNGITNGGITVRIQGQNSLLNGNDPLYVVDGVPIVSQLPGTLGGTILGNSGGTSDGLAIGVGNPLSFINPTDIESINILKDADATAIYGSRAANGAILITTKKGKTGPTKLNINLQQGIGQVARQVPMMNTAQYLQMRREALKNDGLSPGIGDYDLLLWDTTRNTNWQRELLGNSAHYTQLSSDISGGTIQTQYILGATYHRETTVFPGSFSNRKAAVHINLNNTSANQKFNIQFSSNYLIDDNKLPIADLTQRALLLEPNAPKLYNTDGTLNWAPTATGTSSWTNPLSPLLNNYKNITTNLISNLNIGYHLLQGLELKINAGYTVLQSDIKEKYPLIAVRPERRSTTSRNANYSKTNINTWILEPQLSYSREVIHGTLNLLLGATIQQNNNSVQATTGTGFNDDAAMESENAAAQLTPFGSFLTSYKYNAVFGRLNYNWSNKYLMNLTARRDGSSRFGPSSRFHYFASVGAAWIFSAEKWLKSALPFLSFGKLRVSYGTTGSDQIPDYSYLDLYSLVLAYDGVPYQGIRSIISTRLFNPYLQWEQTRKLQAGLDLGWFDDRILLNITYQRNRSSNQLLSYKLPGITGFSSITSNFPANIQNTSLEGSVQVNIIKTRDFNWTATINLTVPNNKLISFPDLATSAYSNTYVIGQPVSISRVFHSPGVDPVTGKYTYTDIQSKPIDVPAYPADLSVQLSTLPKYYGGFQQSLSYKGLQLDMLFQFVNQNGFNYNKVSNSVNIFPGQFASGFSNQSTSVLSHWQKPGDHTQVAAYTTIPSISYYYIGSSDYIYQNTSYIRLKNLSLSWQLPGTWSHDVHMQNIRIYLQGQNILTITKYKQGDPENGSNTSLPPLRVITAGLQVSL